MKHFFNTLFIASIALVAVSCDKKQEQQARPAIPYAAVEVPVKTVTGHRSFQATIEGRVNNSVRAKISGYIQELYVDEGQHVTKGQPLFRLETNILNQSANAAKSGIVAAESSVNVAQVEVDKLIPLVEKNIVSAVQLETAKANLSRAKSQLAVAKADYQSVEANIDYSIIKSPISGVVGALPFKTGSLVGPNDPTPLTVVSDDSEVFAYFSMTEKEYFDFLTETEGKTVKDKVNNLPEVTLTLANKTTYSEKGKIQTVTGQVDPNTGTVQFRAVFNNANGLLSNGNSGLVNIPTTYENVIVVPESATYEQQGIFYVFKVENDTAVSTPIAINARVAGMTIVNSGVKKGDKIITSGIGTLRNGTAVTTNPVVFDSIINIKVNF